MRDIFILKIVIQFARRLFMLIAAHTEVELLLLLFEIIVREFNDSEERNREIDRENISLECVSLILIFDFLIFF